MELAEIVMNPVRQRIFQYLLLHETGTVKEIRKALPDVPGASLYRKAAFSQWWGRTASAARWRAFTA